MLAELLSSWAPRGQPELDRCDFRLAVDSMCQIDQLALARNMLDWPEQSREEVSELLWPFLVVLAGADYLGLPLYWGLFLPFELLERFESLIKLNNKIRDGARGDKAD